MEAGSEAARQTIQTCSKVSIDMKNTKIKRVLLLLPAILLLSGCAAEQVNSKASSASVSSASEEDAFMEFFHSLFSFDREMVVGKNIALDEITDFYFTRASSTFPPDYQAYRFYIEDDAPHFYHETREGDSWPLTEEDITVSGTKDLSQDEWDEFCSFLEGGHVKKDDDEPVDGDDGPWFSLYWKRDRSVFRDFSFAAYDTQISFEDYCAGLTGSGIR